MRLGLSRRRQRNVDRPAAGSSIDREFSANQHYPGGSYPQASNKTLTQRAKSQVNGLLRNARSMPDGSMRWRGPDVG
jgi:hypothetical protein